MRCSITCSGVKVSRGAGGLQAWTILAPQLAWQHASDLPSEQVQSDVLPALRSLSDEVSIVASQAPEDATAAALQLVQVQHDLCIGSRGMPCGLPEQDCFNAPTVAHIDVSGTYAGMQGNVAAIVQLHASRLAAVSMRYVDAQVYEVLLDAHEQLCSVLVQDVLLAAAAVTQARTVEVIYRRGQSL